MQATEKESYDGEYIPPSLWLKSITNLYGHNIMNDQREQIFTNPIKKPMGRPSKYKPEYCKSIIEFFNVPHTRTEQKIITKKDGTTEVVEITRPNSLPTFERFAFNCDVDMDTLTEWRKVHEEFSLSYKKCKQLQREMANDLAMLGYYNPTYTIFFAKNCLDMQDKVITENKNLNAIVSIDLDDDEGDVDEPDNQGN